MSDKRALVARANKLLRARGLGSYLQITYRGELEPVRFILDAPGWKAHECMNVLKETGLWSKEDKCPDP